LHKAEEANGYIWKREIEASMWIVYFCQLENNIFQIRTEQIINFWRNKTLYNFIDGSDDYIKEMDKVKDKVLEWTQGPDETSEMRE